MSSMLGWRTASTCRCPRRRRRGCRWAQRVQRARRTQHGLHGVQLGFVASACGPAGGGSWLSGDASPRSQGKRAAPERSVERRRPPPPPPASAGGLVGARQRARAACAAGHQGVGGLSAGGAAALHRLVSMSREPGHGEGRGRAAAAGAGDALGGTGTRLPHAVRHLGFVRPPSSRAADRPLALPLCGPAPPGTQEPVLPGVAAAGAVPQPRLPQDLQRRDRGRRGQEAV